MSENILAGCTNINEEINWKKLFKEGVDIKISLNEYCTNLPENFKKINNFKEDIKYTENLLFSTLKEYLGLPKLRRHNFHLENELNSTHQIHNYEFLYHQQDLYEYYDDLFINEKFAKNSNNLTNFNVRKSVLPFSNLLENSFHVLLEYNKNDNIEDKMNFAKMRWYNNSYKNINIDENKINEEFLDNTINPINFILNNFIEKITHFCKVTFNYIKKYSASTNNKTNENILDELLLNEYLKRNKSYLDAAIHINEELENFNVLINYLYENIFQNLSNFPKFSIFRLMMVIWNKEVLYPLLNAENENLNILNKVDKLFKQFLNNEINNNLENKNESKNLFNFSSNKLNHNLNNNYMDNFSSSFESSRFSNKCNLTFNPDYSYNSNEYNLFNNSELIIKHFIEQISSSILDLDCNEFSVYYVNYSKMKISHYYTKLENILMKTFEDVIRNFIKNYNKKNNHIFYQNLQRPYQIIFNLFKDLNLKFINRTKLSLLKVLSKVCLEFSIEDLTKNFHEFLNKNLFTEGEAQNYFKLNNKNISLFSSDNILNNEMQNDIKNIHNKLYEFALDYFSQNITLAEYATLEFIKKTKKNSGIIYPSCLHENTLINFIENIFKNYYYQISISEESDKLILKENKRRRINFDFNETDEILLKYNSINYDLIEQIYIKEIKIENDFLEKELLNRNQNKKNLKYLRDEENKFTYYNTDNRSLISTYDSSYELSETEM